VLGSGLAAGAIPSTMMPSQQPIHGYELVQGIRLLTGGALAFGQGCAYAVLHRLEAERLIHGAREQVGSGRALSTA